MKKILFILFGIFFSFALTLSSDAKPVTPVGNHEVAIGGVGLTSRESYVQSVYGMPDETTYKQDEIFGKQHVVRYGNSFFITYGSKGNVISVKTTANNGLKTPAGITVGQPISEVTKYFPAEALRKGDNAYYVNGSWTQNMSFKYNKKKIITEISIYWTP